MGRGPGELQRKIGEVLAAANRRGEGLTAREICHGLYGDYDYATHVRLLQCLRTLKRRG
jgi:hypothetical protein